ncbi:MAG: polar amino acid transport system ATP-binding protein [Verrucomicrobia bacterium]|nr:MAG: polar amino acid transport system ATP-binding protein [Verrucomicrobiota bacterium]
MKLKLSNVARAFGRHKALDGVSLEVRDCRALVFIGPSGGGKSTLLRILAGLEKPDSGEVEINGKPLVFEEAQLLKHRRNLGVVFQGFNLFPHLSAVENVVLPLTAVHGHTHAQAREVAMELLRRFQLDAHADKKPAALSGGQKQRIAIARALAVQPQVLLLDEPTSALDPAMTAEVLETIELLRDQGRDFILATHEMGFARKVADQVAFIAEGRLVELAEPGTLFGASSAPATRRFLERVLRW